MTGIKNFFMSSIVFWIAWIIIPLIMEVIPTIGDFFILLKRKFIKKKYVKTEFLPEITLIIPVYNSENTLYDCIRSVYESDYPNHLIYIMLVNNMTKDDSFQVFCQCQKDFPELMINWMNARQGKSRALNLALFNSNGKYIIHIDSDGVLEPSALRNMVMMFENEDDIHCITGTILTNPKQIDRTKNPFLRLFQKVEFGEYCQAFLAGRNFQSELNSIFTLSGAFSAFRKSAILKSQLYNTDTVCEDTHVTFQIRDGMGKRVALCPNAIFFVDPIGSVNDLYVQRQRWQSGELEVMHMFMKKRLHAARGFASDFVVRVLMYDHTFAFPRMIWYFALICLAFINYPVKLILQSVLVMYLMYSLSNLLLYICIILFLKEFKELRSYYARKWYIIFLLPLFNFLVFWFRFAGIINSIKGVQTWKVRNVKEEWQAFGDVVARDFGGINRILKKIQDEVNENEE
ncbi:MAG: TIGR03111 family XrtG-associated glycosyltransferase [Lachnospiraceae bacterium]